MFRIRSPYCIVLLSVGFFSLAQAGTALASDLVLDSRTTVLFSTLDGGPDDEDGAVDGILTLSSLVVTGSAQIVLDVPAADFVVAGDVRLEGNGAIRPNPATLPATGPTVSIQAGGSIVVTGTSTLSADGASMGGALFVCAAGKIELCGTAATIASSSADPSGLGGLVWIQAGESLRLTSGAVSIKANGATGGNVFLVACGTLGGDHDPECAELEAEDEPGSDATIFIQGKVQAIGANGSGGSVDVIARQGAITINGKKDRIVATGNTTDGTVTLRAATTIIQKPNHIKPSAVLVEDSPSVQSCACPIVPPAPVLNPHDTMTNAASVMVSGLAPGAVSVEVSGPGGTVAVPVLGSEFGVDVPLQTNRVNQLFFTAVARSGARSAPTGTAVTQDSQPPNLFIDFPADQAEITTETTDVAGRVGDLLSGFMGLTVTVNGIPAIVDVGIGNNGTFFAGNVPLGVGPNAITAVGTDELGNSRTRQINVTRVEIPAGSPQMVIVSGNRQTGPALAVLPEPVVVRVTRGDGSPFPNKLVTFDVTRSNGRLTTDGTGEGSMMLQIRADANGEAQAFWKLGSDAGCGNNRIEAISKDIVGTTFFCASATPGPAAQINIGSGNNQRAEADAPAPEPLRVWVSDACNGVQGVSVMFTVRRGGGRVNGQDQVSVVTGDTGHAEVNFTLGPDPGNNEVEAEFAGNAGTPAFFVVFGIVREEEQPTSFSGLVLDNGGRPIGGAACDLVIGQDPPLMTTTSEEGQFRFDDLGASGPAEFHVDGLTATSINGEPIPQGSFPSLQYDLVLVPNAQNALPTPVLLPPLNPNNAVVFDNTQDVDLTVDGIDGLKMTVRAGSMTRADGTVPSPADPAILALNQVHFDDVPMPMPDGAAPPFAWTLQPAGATFDPPVDIVYPNMSGLPAGSIAYFLSFNHDTGRFEIIATGQVSDDGSSIVSDPGAGIIVSGWGCNCPPYSITQNCMNCNVSVEGPECAFGEPGTYTATVTGNGTLTWVASGGGSSVVIETVSVSDGDVVSTDYMFQTPGPPGSPLSSGNKIEANLACEDGLLDQHGVGVRVVDGCDVQTYAASGFANSAIVHSDFVSLMNQINAHAVANNVRLLVTSSFRTSTNVAGAIVQPARMSNHLVGHAIDMNVQFGAGFGQFCNSTCLSRSPLPPGVMGFIQAIQGDAALRWGGDFSMPDVVHIDDGLNLANPGEWQLKFDTVQCQAMQSDCP